MNTTNEDVAALYECWSTKSEEDCKRILANDKWRPTERELKMATSGIASLFRGKQ